jgi:signal recognition particle receptor subunit beta
MNHPFTCIVAGPTKAGKTVFVKKLIENKERIINQTIQKNLVVRQRRTTSLSCV